MSFYLGRHAELYDLIYGEKPYPGEAAFVRDCLHDFGNPPIRRILDLACGTGSHALALEQFGYDVTAIDCSADLLTCAGRKALEAHSKVQFLQGDMRKLPLPSKPFHAVTCLFDSIGYLQTNEALGHAFHGINRSLEMGGLLIIEFWHAPAMLNGYEEVRLRRFKMPDGYLLRISETKLDRQLQLAHVSYSLYEFKDDGAYTLTEETQINRFFQVQEMAAFLSEAGFETVRWFSGFNRNQPITDQTWHVMAVARKGANA